MNNVGLRQWLQLSIVWFLVAAIPVGRAWLFSFSDFWFYVTILAAGLAVAPFLVIWISYLQRSGRGWFFIIIFHAAVAVGLSAIHHSLTSVPKGEMRRRVSEAELKSMDTPDRVTFYALSGSTYSVFTSFMILSALGLLVVYNEQIRQRIIGESALRESLTRSQIKALQSELQPHFIFNTLHSVNSLMETDVEKAQDLIEQFSFLMRHYLSVTEKQFYTLRDEVDFLKQYVAVLQYRYAKEIVFEAAVSEEYLSMNVPVILLQPVVENCIKHSRIDNSERLVIELKCRTEGKTIVLTVRDNGTAPSTDSVRLGVGLRNLQERLSFIYGDKYSYSSKFDNGYVTTVSFPDGR